MKKQGLVWVFILLYSSIAGMDKDCPDRVTCIKNHILNQTDQDYFLRCYKYKISFKEGYEAKYSAYSM